MGIKTQILLNRLVPLVNTTEDLLLGCAHGYVVAGLHQNIDEPFFHGYIVGPKDTEEERYPLDGLKTICQIAEPGRPKAFEDACLIAAAPDMLEALEHLATAIGLSFDTILSKKIISRETIDMMNQAIAKARGES